ncbi:MAG: hypothetical protein RQ826_17755, partial [Xanthomonadales bacterium]|nr:hypothetical protein [Xanthomonadales bacterium]
MNWPEWPRERKDIMKSSSKRITIRSTVFAGLFFLFSATANAASIAFFDNDTYTDVDQESVNLIASLESLGHTVNVFSGIAAADWETATQANDLLVIPELDNGGLFPDLDAEAQDAIFDYVTGGGGLIMFNRTSRTLPVLNGIFGYSLSGSGRGGSTTLNVAAAAGTAFEGGPATLPPSDAVDTVTTASLPAGALDLYNDAGDT